MEKIKISRKTKRVVVIPHSSLKTWKKKKRDWMAIKQTSNPINKPRILTILT